MVYKPLGTHNPHSTEGRPGESKEQHISHVTNRSGRWDETSAHKTLDAEGGHRGWDKWTQAPRCRWQLWGSRDKCAKSPMILEGWPGRWHKCTWPHNTKGELRGVEKAHKSSVMQTAQKRSTSHFQASASITGQDREQKALAMIPERSRGLAAVKQWKGHLVAVEIDMSNIAKARRTAQRCTEPIDTRKPITGHCTALQKDERSSSINQNTSTSSPTRKTSQDSNPTPSWGQPPQPRRTTILRIFYFFPYKSHHLFPLHISTFISHLQCCGVFIFCFSFKNSF